MFKACSFLALALFFSSTLYAEILVSRHNTTIARYCACEYNNVISKSSDDCYNFCSNNYSSSARLYIDLSLDEKDMASFGNVYNWCTKSTSTNEYPSCNLEVKDEKQTQNIAINSIKDNQIAVDISSLPRLVSTKIQLRVNDTKAHSDSRHLVLVNNGDLIPGEVATGGTCTSDYDCQSLCCDGNTKMCKGVNVAQGQFCLKTIGQSCVANDYCTKVNISKCYIVKGAVNEETNVQSCSLRCYNVPSFADCNNSKCRVPQFPSVPSFDPTRPDCRYYPSAINPQDIPFE